MKAKVKTTDILTTNLRVEELELGVFSPRLQFDQKYVEELAEDIKNNGQQKAIITRSHPEKPNTYQVIDGEHRVRAVKKLGLPLVRAEVRKLSDEEATFLSMKINEMHGKLLDPIEEGLQILKLNSSPFNWSEEKIGQMFGRSQQWVSDRIRIARQADQSVLNSITTRVVTSRHAREIVELPHEEQREVVNTVSEHKLSSRTTEALVEALKTVETPEEKKAVMETIPKLKVKQALGLSETLKEAKPEDRMEILSRPIEQYGKIVTKPEEFKRIVDMAPEEAVMEQVRCPQCGKEAWVDWVGRKVRWTNH